MKKKKGRKHRQHIEFNENLWIFRYYHYIIKNNIDFKYWL
jgi:hypothetical protein